MDKQLVCNCFGTIYDAVLSRKPGIMTGKRVDRTDECIGAVAAHMKHMADHNEKGEGFWQYVWPGMGTLTWESSLDTDEKGDTNHRIKLR